MATGAETGGKDDIPAADDAGLFTRADKIPKLIAQKKLSRDAVPDPHWRDGACHACHAGQVSNRKKKPIRLRERSADKVCQYCHDTKFEHSYIHPVDIKPDAAMIARMPDSYRRSVKASAGSITCQTCHDMPLQCLPENRNKRPLNPAFFRDGPFRSRSRQCYFCHDIKKYERLNPHDQVGADGRLHTDTCRICHSDDTTGLRRLEGIENLRFAIEDDLSLLCSRCHPVEPHPTVTFKFGAGQKTPDHLVKPSEKKLKRLRKQTKKAGLVLPLEPGTGKVFCATCHNPHQQGVVKNANEKIGADSRKKRLRADKICVYCHDI